MKFLWSEKLDAVEIHYKLLQAFQKDACTPSNVYAWTGTIKTGHTSMLDGARVRRPRLDHIGFKILSLFAENEFRSIPALVQELEISLSRVHGRLVNVLGFSLQDARSAPSLLTEELKGQRVTTAIEML
jgi:hypothetical protein